MNYLKHPLGASSQHDEAMHIGKPKTTKSMMQRNAYGSLISSLQGIRGLCAERKCVRRAEHEGECYPR